MQDLQMLQDAARRRRWRNATSWLQVPDIIWCALVKYYPKRPCAPSLVESRTLRPLGTHFLLCQQIFLVLVCIHPQTPRVPPRVLASGPKPCGGNNTPCSGCAAQPFIWKWVWFTGQKTYKKNWFLYEKLCTKSFWNSGKSNLEVAFRFYKRCDICYLLTERSAPRQHIYARLS